MPGLSRARFARPSSSTRTLHECAQRERAAPCRQPAVPTPRHPGLEGRGEEGICRALLDFDPMFVPWTTAAGEGSAGPGMAGAPSPSSCQPTWDRGRGNRDDQDSRPTATRDPQPNSLYRMLDRVQQMEVKGALVDAPEGGRVLGPLGFRARQEGRGGGPSEAHPASGHSRLERGREMDEGVADDEVQDAHQAEDHQALGDPLDREPPDPRHVRHADHRDH